jgi:hypothetical protein
MRAERGPFWLDAHRRKLSACRSAELSASFLRAQKSRFPSRQLASIRPFIASWGLEAETPGDINSLKLRRPLERPIDPLGQEDPHLNTK